MTLKKILESSLSEEELKLAPSSFDLVGSKEKTVAIIELPEQLLSKKKVIALALMKKHKNVKTVLLKKSPRSGIYRLHDYELLAGDENTLVIHQESGCKFLVDVRKAYFSTRESTERMRIAKLVGSEEVVMVFFAGVGPFAIIIAKKAKPSRVIGIEINPDASHYFRESLKLNKLTNVEVVEGDVRVHAPKYFSAADRIIMALPETGHEFLEEAMNCLKPEGIVHFYCFASPSELVAKKKLVEEAAKQLGKTVSFHGIHKVLQWGPTIWKMRIDFSVI
ncbi:MAG: class I SAM-dependent methyltransferase family protein [Candidatus Aenigmatarchaeota archaeon]